MNTQPTPIVSDADLARVLAREFEGESRRVAEDLLSRYDSREGVRVKLAAIKLSSGDLGSLERFVRVASEDYRDVLAPAEYPQYGALPPNASSSERARAIDADWKQYQEWLQRS